MSWIRTEDLNHATGQINQRELFEKWPGLAWEQYLEWHSRDYLTFMMGEIVAACRQIFPNEPKNSRRVDVLAKVCRKVLTLVYASVYWRMGKRLPELSEEKAHKVFSEDSATFRVRFLHDDGILNGLKNLNPLLEEGFRKMTEGTIPYGSARFVIYAFTRVLLNELNDQGSLNLLEPEDDTFQRWLNISRRFNMPENEKEMGCSDPKPTDPEFWNNSGGVMLAPPPPKIDPDSITFASIGGQEKAKAEMKKLCSAISSPERYKRWGARPIRGILLKGPPGTGKTILARALAGEAEAEFISVDAKDIFSKWYGDSENNVEKLFARARESKTGAIIFIDEADTFIQNRDNSDTHEVTARIIGSFNRMMDGFKPSDKVVVIFATNHSDNIDPAIKRAGRIDRIIEVLLPDQKGREEIFRIHMKKAEMIAERQLFQDVDIVGLAESLVGYNGADIAEILRRTLENKIVAEDEGRRPGPVTTQDISVEISSYERKPEDPDPKKLKKLARIGF